MVFFPEGEGEGENWVRFADAPPERASLTLSPEQVQALVGEYAGPQLSMKVFVDAQGVLRGQVGGQFPLQLYAQTPRQLYVKEVGASFAFEPAAGPASSMTLTQGPTTLVLQRKAP